MIIDNRKYADYIISQTVSLLGIDSPTGFTENVTAYVSSEFRKLGCEVTVTNKGAVLVCLPTNADGTGNGLVFEAHVDTLGAMVSSITSEGRLKLTNIGGTVPANIETENVKVYSRAGEVYEGTVQLANASAHVNKELGSSERSFKSIEVVLDEKVSSDEDVRNLGINVGDFVCPSPRTVVTSSGYIKSRYLDDKLSVGCLLGYAKYLNDSGFKPDRPVYFLITVYEEVGHGGSCSIPEGVTEVISVDMGCVGENIQCTELDVSICAKDSGGPYDYGVTNRLIKAAEKENASYKINIYPYYGSDVEATLRSGYDVRHGLIGPGVYASHGYERSHTDGVLNTFKVIKGFVAGE